MVVDAWRGLLSGSGVVRATLVSTQKRPGTLQGVSAHVLYTFDVVSLLVDGSHLLTFLEGTLSHLSTFDFFFRKYQKLVN